MRLRHVLVLLALLTAAGCVGSDAAPDGDGSVSSADGAQSPTVEVAPDREPGPEPAAAAPEPRVVRKEVETRTTLGVGFPCLTGGSCSASVDTTRADFGTVGAGASRATLTVTWTAATPLAERLVVELFRLSDGVYLVEAEGTGPLVVDVPLLAEAVALGGLASPSVGGVLVEQTALLVLELEYA